MGNSQAGQNTRVGYQIVATEGASMNLGLVLFFDYIVSIDGIPVVKFEYEDFKEKVKESQNKCECVCFGIYNTKSGTIRTVEYIPKEGTTTLGFSFRLSTFVTGKQDYCRVLGLEAKSPADKARLLGDGTDYLLGTTQVTFGSIDTLFEVLSSHMDQPCKVFVYNTKADTVRVTSIIPSRNWPDEQVGNASLLGADVACGILHDFPKVCSTTLGTTRYR